MKINGKPKLIIILGIIFFIAFFIALYFYVTDIRRPFNLNEKAKTGKTYSDTIKIGVISRFTPEKIYEGYQPIMDYLTKKTGVLFELKLGSSYRETLRELKNGEVLAAFLGSYIFAVENDGTLQAVLKPLTEYGNSFFRSALITKESSEIYRVEDLIGKKVALPSPEAFSGNWLEKILLKKHGISPGQLKEIKHFAFHNSVVRQVLMGNYDAGVVKDRVAKEYTDKGIRTVVYSEPIPGSPIVISDKSDKAKTEILIKALLEAGKNDTKNWDKEFSYGFVRAENSDYDFLRKLFLKDKK